MKNDYKNGKEKAETKEAIMKGGKRETNAWKLFVVVSLLSA